MLSSARDAPYGRASNGTFTITASNVELRLPVMETAGTCGALTPAAPVFPPMAPEGATTTSATVIGTTTTSTTMPSPSAPTVRGKRFVVKNPGSPDQRKIVGIAKERGTDDTILGNPVANSAAVQVVANGGTSYVQNFSLPKEGWRAMGSLGYRYTNRVPGGAIRSASIRRTPTGVFILKIVASGRHGAVDVLPPDSGSDGGFVLTLNGIYRYCVGFGGAAGIETADNSATWSVKNPAGQACPTPAGP